MPDLGELLASGGDMPPEEFRALAHEAVDWMADYLDGVGDLPVFPSVRPGDVRTALPPDAPQAGEDLARAMADFRRIVVPGLTHWNHPAFFGYFSVTGSGPGILGEMLSATLNVNAMVWRSAPAATELEEVVLGWLGKLLGLPGAFEGVINDTASSSSLYALAAAREIAFPEAHARGLFAMPRGRIYASTEAHSSIEKAALTLGFGQDGFRTVEADEAFRMRPEALARAIEEDVAAGIRPVAVCATVGTTSTTSVDPVAEIAAISARHGVWLHVDGAYGGAAAVAPEFRPLMAGWERADSIVVNPHKWLFTPIDCSVLYCRRPEALRAAFSIVPEYLRSAGQREARDLMDYGVSLGRRFRALKLWFVLRYFGREGLAERIRAHVRMAQALAGWIDDAPDWERMAPTPFSTVAFRFAPPGRSDDDLDRLNQRILDRVNASGEAFLTHTRLRGRMAIRLAIGNLKTTEAHVRRAWELLDQAARISVNDRTATNP